MSEDKKDNVVPIKKDKDLKLTPFEIQVVSNVSKASYDQKKGTGYKEVKKLHNCVKKLNSFKGVEPVAPKLRSKKELKEGEKHSKEEIAAHNEKMKAWKEEYDKYENQEVEVKLTSDEYLYFEGRLKNYEGYIPSNIDEVREKMCCLFDKFEL